MPRLPQLPAPATAVPYKDMQLTQEALNEFKAIYKAEFGEEISDAEALEMGTRLLRVFHVLLEVGNEETKNAPPDN